MEDRIDYAFLSPFFDSISKEGYKSNQQLWHIAKGVNRKKSVALGGIEAKNIAKIQSLGMKGAAVLGAVWKPSNPVEAFLKCKRRGTPKLSGGSKVWKG